MSTADNIQERNQELRNIEKEAVEEIRTFYDENREEIDDSAITIPEVPEEDEIESETEDHDVESIDIEELKQEISEDKDEDEDDHPTAAIDMSDGSIYQEGSLAYRFEQLIEDETAFEWIGGRVPRTIERVLEDEELAGGSFQADSEEVTRLEYENFADYFEQVKEQLDLEDPDAAYLGAGMDTVPAAVIGGDWKYVGLEYEQDHLETDDASIEFVNQDLTEGLPQVEGDSLDLVLLKTLGPATGDIDEAVREQAHEKVSENGYVVSDREIESLEEIDKIEPVPETFSTKLHDPNTGAMIYNTSELKVYQK